MLLVPGVDETAGVARYFPNPDHVSAEFACAVADQWQGRGVGTVLMNALIACARDAGYESMEGEVLSANTGMLTLAAHLGFVSETGNDPNHTIKVVLALEPENAES